MNEVEFPSYSNTRCLMMPYVQGHADSLPDEYAAYRDIVSSVFVRKGDVGFLTIDESTVTAGSPHRGQRARCGRALHTEAGIVRGVYGWGDAPSWGGKQKVTLDRDVRILVASNMGDTCAVWSTEHEDTSTDGDLGHVAAQYPYREASMLKKGEVRELGILTPHESLPVKRDARRQFLRIVSSGVHGREDYFTANPLVPFALRRTTSEKGTAMGTRRGEADDVRMAVHKGGRITRPTLDRLLALLSEKTTHECHIAVEVMTPTMLKTIDNEDDALETIRRLEGAPMKAASSR